MSTPKTELKTECLRLRTQENKSLREIHAITGASKGSLSAWLRDTPLSAEVLKAKSAAANHNTVPKKDRGEESRINRMVTSADLNSNQRSRVAELAVALRMAAVGFEVFGSVVDGTKSDWVVLVPSAAKLLKVQVKMAFKGNSGLPIVPLRRGQSTAKYNDGDMDFLVGYDIFTDTAYVWSWQEIRHLAATVSIGVDAEERWDKMGLPLGIIA